MRQVFYQGSLFNEGPKRDYEWGPAGDLICHNPVMRDAGQIRVIDIPDATEPGVVQVKLYEPTEEDLKPRQHDD